MHLKYKIKHVCIWPNYAPLYSEKRGTTLSPGARPALPPRPRTGRRGGRQQPGAALSRV